MEDKIHVLIAVPFLRKEHLEKIAAIDPRLEVTDAMDELRAELGLKPPTLLRANSPEGARLTPAQASARMDKMLAHAEVFFGWQLPPSVATRAPHLKWIQTIGVGIDHIIKQEGIRKSDIMVTNASGLNSTSVAEYALYLLLMLAKGAIGLFASRREHRWERLPTMELEGRTLGIIGLGKIGSKLARRARAFGMRVLAARQSATERAQNVGDTDVIYPAGELLEVLRQSDFAVLAVPLTPQTTGMIGEAELRAMKPSAYLINVARGPVVKQEVLVRALREGWIAGAALDVYNREPLPPENELWTLPNVIISPHVAGISEHEAPVMMDFFSENLRRFLRGEALINLIDKEKGY